MRALSLFFLVGLLACSDKSADPDTGDSPATDDSASEDSADPADDSGDDSGGDSGGDTGEDRWETLRSRVRGGLGSSYATGASVAVMVDGEIVFAEGFGTADPDGDVPVTTETLFNVGSDTKKIAAIALLQQVEAGSLSLDDTLAEALPELVFASDPDLSARITLEQLLTHETSLYDDTNWWVDADDGALADYAYGEFAANEYAMAEPGHMWNYSNPNFSLAGLATEVAGGAAWGDLVQTGLFEPLGMDHSFTRLSEVVEQPDVALGYGIIHLEDAADLSFLDSFSYEYEIGTMPLEDFPDSAWVRPAGGVWSTPTDMLKLAKFLMDGDTHVLSDEHVAAITTPAVPFYPELPILHYGYGMMMYSQFTWTDGAWHELPLWMHGGNHLAYTSHFYVLPEQGIAVSILSNGYGDDFSNAVWEAFDIALDGEALPDVVEGPSLEADPATFGTYVGTWVDPYVLGEMILSLDGEDLHVELPDVDALGLSYKSTLTPDVPGLFLLTVAGYTFDLTFITPDGEAEPRWARNRSLVFERADDAAEAIIAPPDVRKRLFEKVISQPW